MLRREYIYVSIYHLDQFDLRSREHRTCGRGYKSRDAMIGFERVLGERRGLGVESEEEGH